VSRINPKELKKLYYSIGEVAKMFDVNTSLIRFWEKEFPGINPKKNKKGNRLFTPKEIQVIDRIYELVKEQGYTLDGAKKALKSKSSKNEETKNPNEDVINKLEAIKEQLIAMKHSR